MGRMPSAGQVRSVLIVCIGLAAIWVSGCTSPIVRSQTPESEMLSETSPKLRLVGDMARPWGLRPTVVEGIALVTSLNNTGSDPPANGQREVLIDDMRRRGVNNANELLALKSTSLVVVRAQLPPAMRKGDRIDVEVMAPTRSETTSLRNGWLMQTRLQEMAVLGGSIRRGDVKAHAEGAVVVDALLEGDGDQTAETRGRVLGGAVAAQSRSLGLMLKSEHHSVRSSAMIGQAINARFHTYDRGNKRGVAIPKRDSFVELTVHTDYRHNLNRFMSVVQAIAVNEDPRELLERLANLEQDLQQPATTLEAAIKLEAIGQEAIPVLDRALASAEPLVRFAAAEVLAYQGRDECVPHLLAAARDESALRWNALTALGTLTDADAREALATLLHEPSAETRYGAFNAILDSNPRDPTVRGEMLEDALVLHLIPSQGEPMIHVRRTERPEIVLFGQEICFQTPAAVFAGPRILIKSEDSGRLKISRFSLGKDDVSEYCTTQVADVIRTMVKLGGNYADVVAALTQAKQRGVLTARVAFDALPRPGRQYYLDQETPDETDAGISETSSTDSELLLDNPPQENSAAVQTDATL